ncbi:TNR18 factor, partial [Orthonyx spaldingii]|nr:TNR18 factor [Orthonyx spaldingii]
TGSSSPCQEAPDPDCKCPDGLSCANEPCLYCQTLPRCPEGQEPHRTGAVNFQFKCKPCETGTYSSGRSSWCRNWTDCESIGFLTLQQGNSTHNSVC